MRDDPRQLLLFDAPVSQPKRARDQARPPEHNVFFGVRPPAPVAINISQLGSRLVLQHGGNPLLADNLHLSLNGVGHYATEPQDAIDRAIAAAATVDFAPFDIGFDRLLTWGRGRSRPTVMRCTHDEPELQALYAAIYAGMARAGLSGERAPGIPHMTLFYGSAVLPEQHLVEPFAWHVDRFCLIYSIHGTGRHHVKGEWLLRGAGSSASYPPSGTGLLF